MNHIDILKQSFKITWRYRPLWVFGFFLALCGGGGRRFNFNVPGNNYSGDYNNSGLLPYGSDFDPEMITLISTICCLVILLIMVSVLVQTISKTALMGMVDQISETEAVTVADGWRLGWSRAAWRLFLMGLLIGIPLMLVSLALILIALSPLLLILSQDSALLIPAILLMIIALLFVMLILMLVDAVITPIIELASRQIVLGNEGVFVALKHTFRLIKRHFKDILIIWLLMFGLSLAWALVSLVIILPISLITAALVGGVPALIVYLISSSWIGAAFAGIPLAVISIALISSFTTGLYLVLRSSVWTLTYIELQKDPPLEPTDDSSANVAAASVAAANIAMALSDSQSET